MNTESGVQALDHSTRRKLILVKQIYQRALAQSQATHSAVDRLFALIGFDLAVETLLKTVFDALERKDKNDRNFPAVVEQALNALKKKNLPQPSTKNILRVHDLRNDAQHQARYPTEIELSDCRTYTRDFLSELCTTVWGQSFEAISLIDAINHEKAKELLLEAEKDFLNNDPGSVAVKSIVVFKTIVGGLANAVTERIEYSVNGIVVTESFKEPKASERVFRAFMRTRELVVFQTLGVNLQDYLRFKRYTRYIAVSLAGNGRFYSTLSGPMTTIDEAKYILEFVTNTVLLAESLDPAVARPFDRRS